MHHHCVNHGRGIINNSIFGITGGIIVHYQSCFETKTVQKSYQLADTHLCSQYMELTSSLLRLDSLIINSFSATKFTFFKV